MNARPSSRLLGFGRRLSGGRERAAREALTLCESVDALARDADASLGVDDDRLFSLLEQREQMLADLVEHVVTLRLERPTADSPLFAATERVVDDADALVTEVCTALTRSHRATMVLALRVSERVKALRAELAAVQRAGSAGIGYATLSVPGHLNNLR